jgi:chemotaxis signal transduction protein
VAEARAPLEEHVPLLRSRAASLARAQETRPSADPLHVIVFTLGGERYGLESACVLHVAMLQMMTPLPGAAAPLFGITQWRGDVLTLLDLRDVFGARARGLTDMGRIVVVDGPDRNFGVVADAVLGMAELTAGDIAPLPVEEGRQQSLLRGMTGDGVLVIDSNALRERYGCVQKRQNRTGRGG